ncbi:MAG: hydrogenase formation protein HypD [Deltaproteobacteria bacterium]|jgi:hydrogenase expression/formation protein HypD|nr:hydrogenase formation protein HypD [Deltaproteobacteria bacterium]
MSIKHLHEYRDPELSRKIIQQIRKTSQKEIRLMEVCGTHTTSIFRNGIRSLLPETISLLSGPGCPVCVTAQNEIDAFIELAKLDDVIIATFGDLIRVPGADSSLQNEQAKGRDVRVVYSTFDAIDIAKKNPDKHVVFLGVGFETTAPTIAASILAAHNLNLDNYFVISAHKLLPPALFTLAENPETKIDGFILPGHVSVIIGVKAYISFFERYGVPCVIAGFEPIDILQAILMLTKQIEDDAPKLENGYKRAVTFEGNPKARSTMNAVFETADAAWRGLGIIPLSGLKIRKEYEAFDAQKVFDIELGEVKDPNGCACGDILLGVKIPPQCPLYKKTCAPDQPIGPCMVSSEGTCAAYHRYHDA